MSKKESKHGLLFRKYGIFDSIEYWKYSISNSLDESNELNIWRHGAKLFVQLSLTSVLGLRPNSN